MTAFPSVVMNASGSAKPGATGQTQSNGCLAIGTILLTSLIACVESV